MAVTINRKPEVPEMVFRLMKEWGPKGFDHRALDSVILLLNPATPPEKYTPAILQLLPLAQKVKTPLAKAMCKQLQEYVASVLQPR